MSYPENTAASKDSTERLGVPSYLVNAEEFKQINRLWSYSNFSVGEASSLSYFKRIKRYIQRKIRSFLLGSYFSEELDFHANVVRSLNLLARAIETKEWRMDDAYRSSLQSLEARLLEVTHGEVTKLRSELSGIKGSQLRQEGEVKTLQSVAQGLERIVSRITRNTSNDLSQHEIQPREDLPDYSYLLLENRYRGSEAEIKNRLAPYIEEFRGETLPVLEIGSGRGELQSLFLTAGIPSYGLEQDVAMYEHCCEQGLDVRLEDGLSHLQSMPDGSFGGLIATQVIEHFTARQLDRLLRLLTRKLKRGGKVVFETINTESMVALLRNYFRDPTHAQPLHPETMRSLLELAGLRVLEVRKLSPFPVEAILQELEVQDYMTPRWKETIELLNHNFKTLNGLLFGSQDYCIIAQND